MDTSSFTDQLDLKIWRTKGARFNAYRRLGKKKNILTYVTSLSSVHLTVIATIQLSSLIPLQQNQSTLLNLTTIAISLVILVYGLIEGGKDYGLKSEKYHMCGLDLDKIYNKLQLAKDRNNNDLIESISIEYGEILEKYSLNHQDVDDHYFQLSHKNSFQKFNSCNPYDKLKVWFFYKWLDVFLAAILTILPIFVSYKIFISNN